MQKYGTAVALDPWPFIMRQFDNDIIKVIGALHGFVSSGIGHPYQAIVIAVSHRLAPAIVRSDRPCH
jgi:hypothetical protein